MEAPAEPVDRPGGDGGGRRLPLLLAVAGVVVAALLAAALITGGGDGDGDGDDAGPAVPTTGRRMTGLLLQRGVDGLLVGATLLIVDPSGAGGDLVYLPPGTMAETASLGLVPLRQSAGQGDDIVRSAVENLLGTLLDSTDAVDPVRLADAVRPAGALDLVVPDPVERREGDRIQTVFPAGPATIAPEQIADLLALPASTDLQRLVRHQTFWEAWLAAIRGGGAAAAPSNSSMGALAGHVRRLSEGTVEHHVLPVEAIGGAESLYQVDAERLDALLARVLPDAPSSTERIAVQVLNGTGAPGVAQTLVAPLVEAGARILLTGNADRFDYATTQIAYYDDEHAAAARRLRDALGVGEVVKSLARIGVVDVTVVVGADFTAPTRGTSPTTQGASP